MALTEHELTQIIKMHTCGAHPTLIAQLLERDPRVILDALASQNIRGPWPKIPSLPLNPTLRAQARTILHERTLLSVIQVIDALKAGKPSLDPNKYMLLLRAIIDEREELTVKST
jgi:hypothetical protein